VWFTEALSTRLDTDRAPIVVVMQRLDRDDLIGRLVEQGGWFLLELPAEDEHGEPIAPSILSREKLDALKAQIGAAAFAAQYQQRPSDDASSSIKRVWWRFHRTAQVAVTTPRPSGCDTTIAAVDTPTRFDRLVISADLTFGGLKASNDFAAITVWGRAGVGRYLLAIWWRRTTQLAQRDAIKALKREYPSAKILVEKAAAGAGVLELLAADGIDALPITPLGSKAERLDLVSPAIESGSVYLPLGAPWLGAFVEELAGATRHDDAQDSTAMALAELATGAPARDLKRESAGWYRVLNAINGNPTAAELELAAAKRVDAMAAKAAEVEREQAAARQALKRFKNKSGGWRRSSPPAPEKPTDPEKP
ncbi:MAG TPA: phage terminase large subunit, partial [Kofleriaceae bacterium]|jgi:predicted phage terminase large subunit-like protein